MLSSRRFLGDRGWLRVLVVDDDAPLRLLLRTTLGTGRFAVRDVPSAEDAAEVVRVWSPTVVILDIGLVGMDGLTFSRELKDRARPPFVILLTGGEVTAEAAMHAGADAVLRKPFSPFDLMTLLESVRASDSGAPQAPVLTEPAPREAEQLLAYARDLAGSSRSSTSSDSCFRTRIAKLRLRWPTRSRRETRAPAVTLFACSSTRSS